MATGGFQPTFTTTHAITRELTRIERARGFLEATTLSEQWVRAMGERALVLEAHPQGWPEERGTSPTDPTKRYVAVPGALS